MSPFHASGRITMLRQTSDKEVLKGHVMAQLEAGKLVQRTAAERLGVSTRRVKRLKRRHVESGVDSLVSKKQR